MIFIPRKVRKMVSSPKWIVVLAAYGHGRRMADNHEALLNGRYPHVTLHV
jgi:hypothetical protein